eukprot:4423608-Pyramimonas_sp.AAC.1
MLGRPPRARRWSGITFRSFWSGWPTAMRVFGFTKLRTHARFCVGSAPAGGVSAVSRRPALARSRGCGVAMS